MAAQRDLEGDMEEAIAAMANMNPNGGADGAVGGVNVPDGGDGNGNGADRDNVGAGVGHALGGGNVGGGVLGAEGGDNGVAGVIAANPNDGLEIPRPERDEDFVLRDVAVIPFDGFVNAEAAFNIRPGRPRRLRIRNIEFPVGTSHDFRFAPFPVLDYIWTFMTLQELYRWANTCAHFNAQVMHCYPLWRRVSAHLMDLTSNIVFDFVDLQLPAFHLYQLCRGAIAELIIPPSLSFECPLRPAHAIVALPYKVEMFRAFPDADYLGVLFINNRFNVYPLSRIHSAVNLYTQQLDPQWKVRDFYLGRRAVFWLGERLDWSTGSSLVSMRLGGGSVVVHSASHDIIRMTVSEEYLIALESRTLVASEIADVGRDWTARRYQLMLIYPMGGYTYATEPAVRQIFHPLLDIRLDGTSLAMLWHSDVPVPSAWETSREGNPIDLGIQELGPAANFMIHPHISVLAATHHENDLALREPRSIACQISLIDRRTPFHSMPPLASDLRLQRFVAGNNVVCCHHYLRINRFVVTPSSHGQFYHLCPPPTPGHDPVWIVFDVSSLNYAEVDRILPLTSVIRPVFAGRSLIYMDCQELCVRRVQP